jgi:hypothetical protein
MIPKSLQRFSEKIMLKQASPLPKQQARVKPAAATFT